MNKSTTVRAVMNPDKKNAVANILGRLGLNHSEAINIYYSLIAEHKGLPFSLSLPEAVSDVETTTDIDSELRKHLKTSIRRNYRLGQLLSR